MVVSKIFYFHPYLGKWSNFTNIFQTGWNHQIDWGFTCFFFTTPFFGTWNFGGFFEVEYCPCLLVWWKKILIRIDSPGTCLAVWLSCLWNQKRGKVKHHPVWLVEPLKKTCAPCFFLMENSHAKLNKNHIEFWGLLERYVVRSVSNKGSTEPRAVSFFQKKNISSFKTRWYPPGD